MFACRKFPSISAKALEKPQRSMVISAWDSFGDVSKHVKILERDVNNSPNNQAEEAKNRQTNNTIDEHKKL